MNSRANSSTWLKNWNFIIIDLIMFQATYVISFGMKMGVNNPYSNELYLNTGILICLVDLCLVFFTELHQEIIRRGYLVDSKIRRASVPSSELLEEKTVDELLNEKREEYDYILINIPPVSIVARNCDGAVMVIESGIVSYKVAQRVVQQLHTTGCRILREVLNNVG